MKRMKATLTVLAVLLFTIAAASAAQAASQRTFVDGAGSDLNVPNCTRALPCRTWQVAYNETLAGGEIISLSAAGYGGIASITKTITITGPPGLPLAYVPGGTTAFTVNGAASDVIIFRNIVFDGRKEGTNIGIQHNSGKLVVDHCVFEDLTTGISVTNAKGDVIASDFHNNGTGIIVSGSGTDAPAMGSTVSVAQIRINGGNITANTTGVTQVLPGFSGPNTLFNIFIFTFSSSATTNFAGNGTNYNCTGTSGPPNNTPCEPKPPIYNYTAVLN